MGHLEIFDDGTVQNLETVSDGVTFKPDVPGDRERAEREHKAKRRTADCRSEGKRPLVGRRGCEMNSRWRSYRFMPLSNVQKGAIGQFAFLSTALATGGGQVEAYAPVADNEGRDSQVRRHLSPSAGIGVQIKVVLCLSKVGQTPRNYIRTSFQIAQKRIQNDSRLWYFLAFYNPKELRLHDPTFLVRSDVFHKVARTGKPSKGKVWFTVQASVEPDSHDRWTPYRLAPKDLGKRLLEIIDSAGLTASEKRVQLPAEAIWLGRKNVTRTSRLRRAA